LLAQHRSPLGTQVSASVLETFVETVEALSSARTVEDVASVVRSAARRISGADGVSFVLRDGDKCWYIDEEAIEPLWKGQRFPMSACISGWAMLNGETAVIRDIYEDARIPHDAYRPTFVRSLVMTPVRPKDPLAAIGAYWASKREPTLDEVARLAVMARATAVALENARLYATLTDALERRKFLLRELDHRCKNLLAAVQSIADQTLRAATSTQAFADAFESRIAALSRAHEQLTHQDWGRADLMQVAHAALEPFGGVDGTRITATGPDIALSPECAVAMHMTLNELALNALKHGALSDPRGRVGLAWSVDMAGSPRSLSFEWRERDGPVVTTPTSEGFGRRMLERGLARDLGDTASLDFARAGLRFHLAAPLSGRISLA
jgi:two-component sensor histidine kinase